jgi:hypothetical protein
VPDALNVCTCCWGALTPLDGLDAFDVPLAFVAVTVNVYPVPPVSPETVIGLDEPVAVIEPGLDVTVNDVAVSPCGVKETLKDPATPAGVADTFIGASGFLRFCEDVIPMMGIKLLKDA